jgi:PAS domain S-box-containing protein
MLVGHDSGSTLESPILHALPNTIFLCGILLGVVPMAAKSYQRSGSRTFLMMGCGALFLGVSSLMAGWVMAVSGNRNPTATLHNLGSLLAGFCHLASAHYLLADLVGTHPPKARSRRAAIPYAGIVAFVSVVAALAVAGKLPVFFAPGGEPSLLRQFVVGGALCMFALSGLMFVGIYFATKTKFAYWYGLALLLVAVGLVCFLCERTAWGRLGWLGRSAQYLGSVYFIFALLAGRREMGQTSASAADTTRWGLWPYLEQKVKERTLALEKEKEDLQKEIAARKLTERALKESEERYRRLFEAESDAIFVVDRETERMIDANPAALKLYGYSRQEILLLKASDVSTEPEKARQSIAERQTFIPLRLHRKKDGAVFPVEIARSFFRFHDREIHVAAIRDITERRRAEEELKESEERFRLAADAARFGIYRYDFASGAGYWSPEFKALLGVPPDQPLALDADKLFQGLHPDDRPNFRAAITAAKDPRGSGLFLHDCRVIHPNGEVRWLNVHGQTTFAGEGSERHAAHAAGVVLDITERKQAEEALRKSEAELNHAQALAHVGNWSWDIQKDVMSGSPEMHRIYGVESGAFEFTAKGVAQQIHPEDLPGHVQAIQTVLQGGMFEPYEFRVVRPDGSMRVVQVFTAEVKRNASGQPIWLFGAAQDITERREADEALRRSETKFRTLYDSTGDAIVLLDEKNFLDCNPAALVMFGCATREEFCSKHPADVSPPMQPDGTDSLTLANQRIATAIAKGSHQFEWMHKRTDTGEVFPADVQISALELDGKWVLQATIRDITERREVEEALRRSETKFRTLFDSTSDAVMLLGEKGFFDCNPATLAMFGYATREEFCTKNPADVSPPMQPDGTDSLTLANRQMATALEKGRHQFEWMHKRADTGEAFAADVLLSALELDGKRVLQATVRDITERKQAEEELREREARYRTLAENFPHKIFMKDRNFQYVTVNENFSQDFGLRPEEFVGKVDYDFSPKELSDKYREDDKQVMETGQAKELEEWYVPGGRKIWVHTTKRPVRDKDGGIIGIFGIFWDISKRKQAEDELRDSHKQLRALAARMRTVREEERTRVAREIHDVLAQELTSLKIDVTLLARLLAQSPGELEQSLVREKLAGMALATDTAIQSVQKIATELRPVVLDSLGLGAAIEWQAKDFQARTGIGCRARLAARNLLLDRDRSTALFRILQESLTNVVRHAAATQVEIVLQCKAGCVKLTIQDNGRGIQESQANAPSAVGLLGLRERALLLGGRCEISGRPGEGTRVEVRIPLAPKGNSEDKQL